MQLFCRKNFIAKISEIQSKIIRKWLCINSRFDRTSTSEKVTENQTFLVLHSFEIYLFFINIDCSALE